MPEVGGRKGRWGRGSSAPWRQRQSSWSGSGKVAAGRQRHPSAERAGRAVRETRGFTLIEVMIVVVIVGILAAIAYPAYTQHVVKTHRRTATACLMEMAQQMERYYTAQMTYVGAALPNPACRTDLAARYDFSFQGNVTASAYTLQAVAKGAQTKDSGCTTLTLNQAGVRMPANCWQ